MRERERERRPPAFVCRGGVDIAVGDLWAGTRPCQLPSESATWMGKEKKDFTQPTPARLLVLLSGETGQAVATRANVFF